MFWAHKKNKLKTSDLNSRPISKGLDWQTSEVTHQIEAGDCWTLQFIKLPSLKYKVQSSFLK